MDLLQLNDDELPLFQLEAVKDFPSMALHLSEYVSRIKQLSTLKAVRDIVRERCRRLASPNWAAAVLQQMGVPLAPTGPALGAPFQFTPPPGVLDLVPVRMNLSPVAEGLLWPAYVAAVSTYFRCEVHGPHLPSGLATKGTAVKSCFLLLPASVWRSVSASLPPPQIPMGPSGLMATITDTHPDGSSIKPWTPPGLCLTRQWADSLRNTQSSRAKHEPTSHSEPPHKRQRSTRSEYRECDAPPPPPATLRAAPPHQHAPRPTATCRHRSASGESR